jgi:hypothetical protein
MTTILRVLFSAEPMPSCEDRLDADDSGEINVSDAQYVGNALFRDGPTFPPPYPQPGTDPTPDSLACKPSE